MAEAMSKRNVRNLAANQRDISGGSADRAATARKGVHPVPPSSEIAIVDDLRRRHLFGLDFVDTDGLQPIVDAVLDGPYDSDRLPILLTPNVDIVVCLRRTPRPAEADAFERAQFCLPDGQPIVWASRMLGEPLTRRLTGSGLFSELWPRLCAESIPVCVVASSSEIADGLAAQHAEARFVVPPMFGTGDRATQFNVVDRAIAEAIAGGARLILFGIGNPRDALLAEAFVERWPPEQGPPPLSLGLGASFAMHLGHVQRAPDWMQRVGLEWFHRFCQEPRRLFRRYFVRDIAYIGIVYRAWRARKEQDRR